MGVAVADYDGDGRMDVFVTNDRAPHFLYRNGADGKLSEVAFEAGVAANETGAMVSGMGCDFKDFDDDGWPDIFLTDLMRDTFTLFVNQGKGFFLDRTFPSGVGLASAAHSGWSTKFLDVDNDGRKDIFVAGSHVVDNVELYSPGAKYEEAASSTATWARAGSRTSPSGSAPISGSPARGAGWRWPTSTTTAPWRSPSPGSTDPPRSS